MNARSGQQRSHSLSFSRGFTLVELLIVIVVIAILAGIVIISYGNWRTSILQKQVQNDLKQAASTMEDAKTFGTGYPTAIPTSFSASPGTVLSGGGSSDGTTFCINGTTSANATIKYYITDDGGAPKTGTCPSSAGQNTPTGSPTWTASPITISGSAPYSLTASWNTPSGLPGGASVTGSVLQCSSDLGFQVNVLSVSVSGSATTAMIAAGLSTNTTYFCRVAALVNGTQGAWSPTASGTTGS